MALVAASASWVLERPLDSALRMGGATMHAATIRAKATHDARHAKHGRAGAGRSSAVGTGTPWRARTWLAHLADYWTLTKPEVNFLVLVSTLVGFYLAAPGALNGWLLFHTLMGTLLVASGTGTLNQYLERRTDAFMRRTANRPLPAGRLKHQGSLVVRNSAFRRRRGGTLDRRQSAHQRAGAGDPRHLSDFLHAAQAENAALHFGGGVSRAPCRRSSAGPRSATA